MWEIKSLVICVILKSDCNTRMNLHLLKMLLEESETSVKLSVTPKYIRTAILDKLTMLTPHSLTHTFTNLINKSKE